MTDTKISGTSWKIPLDINGERRQPAHRFARVLCSANGPRNGQNHPRKGDFPPVNVNVAELDESIPMGGGQRYHSVARQGSRPECVQLRIRDSGS